MSDREDTEDTDGLEEILTQDDIVNELLIEFKEQRVALKSQISELEKLQTKIDSLFPKTLDARYMRYFEEKVKTATALFNALLDVRKEITRSLKDEIELRRRLFVIGDGDGSFDDLFDVRVMARKVEKYQREQKTSKEEIDEQ